MASLTGTGVTLPEDTQRKLNLVKGVGALLLVALWGWFAFIKDAEVPILQFLDIAVHEIGHKVFSPFGETTMLIMGSGSECFFPFVLGLVFGIWKRDLIAWGICWAWSAGACADAARYIGDATEGSLALLGGGPDALGDWERILGPEHWDKLHLADDYAHNVRTIGLLIWCAALVLVIAGMWLNWRGPSRRREAPAAPSRQTAPPTVPMSTEDMWR